MNDMRQGTCPLCGHNEIIDARPIWFNRSHSSGGGLYVAERAGTPHGPLWSFTCRRCDYTQMFAQGAAALPIGPEYDTRIVVGPAPKPFR